jgi:hypothetical protein
MPILMKFSRSAATLVCGVALAGCVSAPVEELLASTDIVNELRRESGALVEVAQFSAGRAGKAPPGRWEPFVVSRFSARTEYRLVESGPRVVLEGSADASASGFYRRIRFDPVRYPVVEWRWRISQPLADADPRVASREDSAARLVVSFHGDVTRLDFFERATLRLYKALSGEKLPYAMIMYVWSSSAPAGTIVPNIHTDKIQIIVVDSGNERIGEWREFRRNVLEDYRLVFGEDPWDIVAVGVMTDAAHTRQKARAEYGDITFRPAR